MRAELLDSDAAILENTALPVDVADRRRLGRDAGWSRHEVMGHDTTTRALESMSAVPFTAYYEQEQDKMLQVVLEMENRA